MIRQRLATAAAAVGLGLVSGCFSLCEHPFFARLTGHPACCEMAGVPVCEGPMLDCPSGACAPGPMMTTPVMPPGAPGMTAPPLTPQPSVPPLAPAPRLVPQPTQSSSRPLPYNPQR